MNINTNGYPINTGAPLPFLPPPPGAPPTFNPTDSWTPSSPAGQAPGYQPAFQAAPAQATQAQAPVQDESYQFACFRPENWTYPSTLVNNTYTPATSANQDPRAAMLRQREEAFNLNRRNMAAGWNNYSRSVVDPNRGYGTNGYNNGVNGYNGGGLNNYNGYNANTPGSYMYGGGRRTNNNYY
ncbi:hypothetical protein JST97_13245 [bacterium]|nr:hypothetical protein [bacterium]